MGRVELTVAVKVTVWPTCDGLGDEVTVVVVIARQVYVQQYANSSMLQSLNAAVDDNRSACRRRSHPDRDRKIAENPRGGWSTRNCNDCLPEGPSLAQQLSDPLL